MESIELLEERRRKLRAADQFLEGLMHIERARDELPRTNRAAVVQHDAGGLAAFDHDAIEFDLRLKSSARRDESLHQSARQIERAALAELIAALQIERADHRAHRAGLRHRVNEPGAEQRDLEQKQKLHMLVLEQLLAPRRTAAAASSPENRGRSSLLRQQRLALGLRQRLGEALRQEDLRA